MSEQIIKLSDTAAARIKEIMSNADNKTIGVRIGVKSGGCAGMSYSMEYAKDKKANDEIIEDKGVKVFIDPAAIIYLRSASGFEVGACSSVLFSSVVRNGLWPGRKGSGRVWGM